MRLYQSSSYDRHGSLYLAKAIVSLLRHFRIGGFKGACIVDVVAGRGKLIRLLAARDVYYDILAAELHDRMRAGIEIIRSR